MEGRDGFLQGVAADEPHGVVRSAVAALAEPVDGDDAGMLEAAGDLGLDQETGAADRVVGVVFKDLLEGDLAVEFLVQSDEHLAQPAARVRPEHADAQAVGGGAIGSRAVGIGVGQGGTGGNRTEGGVDVRVGHAREPCARRGPHGHRCKAPLGVAPMLFEVTPDKGLDRASVVGVEIAAGLEMFAEAPALVAGPRLERGDELDLVDQAVLECEEPEKEAPRRVGIHERKDSDLAVVVGGSLGRYCRTDGQAIQVGEARAGRRAPPPEAARRGGEQYGWIDTLFLVWLDLSAEARHPRSKGGSSPANRMGELQYQTTQWIDANDCT